MTKRQATDEELHRALDRAGISMADFQAASGIAAGAAGPGYDTSTAEALAASTPEPAIVPGHPLPPAVAHAALLQLIDSPFVRTDEDGNISAVEVTEVDAAMALYVLTEGERAVRPIVRLHQRRRALEPARAMAERSPEYYRVYCEQLSEIDREYTEAFADAALSGYAAVVAERGLQTVIAEIMRLLADAFEAAALIAGNAVEKKTSASTSNGSPPTPSESQPPCPPSRGTKSSGASPSPPDNGSPSRGTHTREGASPGDTRPKPPRKSQKQ